MSAIAAGSPPRTERAILLWRWAPHVVVAVVGLALVPFYRFGVGLDGLSYVSIAEHYAAGRLDVAVNAYWSPLFSWLLVPFIAGGVEALLAATLVGVASAVAALQALRRLLAALEVADAAAAMATLAAAPFVLVAALFGIFADLLLAALLVAYTAEVLTPDAGPPARSWRAGVLAALAVLTKLYAAPFVLAHLVVVTAWHARPGVDGRARRDALLVAGRVTALLVGVLLAWSAVLSLDAGRPLVSTAPGHNLALVAPDSAGNPIRYAGLLEPPHDDAVSVWEDPSATPVDATSWSASERAAAQRVVDNVSGNLGRSWDALIGWAGILLVPAVVGAVLGVRRAGQRRDAVVGVVAAAAVYLAGYQLLWVEERYLWPVVLWGAALAGIALDGLPSTSSGRRALAALGAVLVVGVLAANLDELRLKWRSGQELATTAAQLADAGVVGDRVADANNWQRSAILCYHLDCAYLGQPVDTAAPGSELAAARVDTYLVWGTEPDPVPSLRPRPRPPGVDDLTIYWVPAAETIAGP